jgi:deoxyribonuclease IV
MRYLGAHIGGGLSKSAAIANSNSINSIQIMPSAPMRWSAKDIPEEQIEKFIKSTAGTSIKQILLHGVYLINLASTNEQYQLMGKMSLISYLTCADKMQKFATKDNLNSDLNILGVCFHPGSAKDLGKEAGLQKVIDGMNYVLEQTKDQNSMLLIEMTAGAGNVMGDTVEEVAQMRNGTIQKERVGYVVDTQHTFVSGYDWINELDKNVELFEKTLGLENIKAFHLNDSMFDLGTHKDRHANLGEGKIGKEAIQALINHPKLKNIPFIMETPDLKDEASIGKAMKGLLELAKD